MNQGVGLNVWAAAVDEANWERAEEWVQHARHYPGMKLAIFDMGLEYSHRKKLEEVATLVEARGLVSYIDLWHRLLDQNLTDGQILISPINDLLDPVPLFNEGEDKMIFTKLTRDAELFFVCRPLVSIYSQAKTANYIESAVAKKFEGYAGPERICGPAYLWKVMVGMADFVRKYQPYSLEHRWEVLVANLFVASYPEYTLLTA